MKASLKLAAVALGCLGAIAAHANPIVTTNFDFYKLGNASGNFTPTSGTFYNGSQGCSGGDLCSSKVFDGHGTKSFGGSLVYSLNGITATASAIAGNHLAPATVVQDHESPWTMDQSGHAIKGAGLGVYSTYNDTSDDNIQSNEWLTITFDKAVTIKGIGLQNDGHVNFGTGKSFLLSVDGGAVVTETWGGGATDDYDLTGTSFRFSTVGINSRAYSQLYLSELDVVAAVPEPETYALMLAGLALVGAAAKRRQAK